MHGYGEQLVLMAQEVSLEIYRNGSIQPAILSELVRIPVQGQAIAREMARNGKGGSPFDDGQCELSHVTVMKLSPVS